jgi:glycosyltransferase involved in cell wall biosynthesis
MQGIQRGPTRSTLAVLITYHDEGELLTDCLQSIQASESAPDEVVVYDDASARSAAHYIPPSLDVRLLRGTDNVGPAIARNRLLAASRAEWIHFHDADDLFLPGWGERVRAAAGDGVDCVFTEVETAAEDGRHHPAVIGLDALQRAGDLLAFCLRRSMLTPAGTYRRELVESMGGYNERLWQSEDFEFHVRLALVARRWHVLPDSLVRVRARAAGRSRRQHEVWRSAWQAVLELDPQIPASHKADLAAGAERVGHQLLQLGELEWARAAFRFAEARGLRPEDVRPGQRWLTRWFGLTTAQRMAAWYRALLPGRLRRAIAALRT